MEREWHTLYSIEKVSNLISFCENAITRNAMRRNNHHNLLSLSFILKIPIFSEVLLPSQTYIVQRFLLQKLSVGFNPGGNTKK